MKVSIDKKNCVKCNACGFNSKGIIRSEDGKPAEIKKGIDLSDPKVAKKIRQTADLCPVGAIIIQE